MAEGWARALGGEQVEAYSAGTEPKGLHPLAVRVMAEAGVDISQQTSKHLDGMLGQSFDYVITVCDRAKESCPVWPSANEHIHWSLDDPAEARGNETERLQSFRRVCLEMKRRIELFLASRHVTRHERAVDP
jgi:arsenate reductase